MKRKSIILAFLMVVCLFVVSCSKTSQTYNPTEEGLVEDGLNAGDTFIFGAYEQDGDETNGKEPIEWDVLSVEEDRMLLISHYVLDCQKYNEWYGGCTWEECTLREWLRTNFLYAAFSEEERKLIQTVELSNPDNPFRGSFGGSNTFDQVFVLSVDELFEYYSIDFLEDNPFYGSSEDLFVEPTQYAKDQGVYSRKMSTEIYERNASWYTHDVTGRIGTNWWLRSPGSKGAGDMSWNAMYVEVFGTGGYGDGTSVDTSSVGVRPALYISTKQPELTADTEREEYTN